MTLVRFRHMCRQRGMAPFAGVPPMRSDPFAFVKDFDGGNRETHVYRLAHEAMGDTVEMPLDFEMIIEMDPRVAPFGIFVGSGRERFEGWLFLRQELGVPRAGEFLEGAVIELRQ